MKLCAHCGALIRFNSLARGWLHAAPLGRLRISRREQQDIYSDPPLKGRELHRQTVLHPAQPRKPGRPKSIGEFDHAMPDL
jgi:hypothetical protein